MGSMRGSLSHDAMSASRLATLSDEGESGTSTYVNGVLSW